MRAKRTISLLMALICLVATTAVLRAEQPIITGRFSADSIEVGDRVEYIIEIDKDRATNIGIPDFSGGLSPKQRAEVAKQKLAMSKYEAYNENIFELIEEYPLDTLEIDGRRLHLRKRYLLAAMETGRIPMRPAILYFEKNRETPDTLYADQTLQLNVLSYAELDTTLFLKADPQSQQGFAVDSKKAMSMLKDEGLYTQKNLPFRFAEIRDYAAYAGIGLIILALIIWAIIYNLRHRKPRRESVVKPQPKLPPHVVAIKALEELGHRKLWQNGKHKQYYTSLASILKVYIDGRWDIGALDKTTGEVIAALRDIDMPRESRSDLIDILQTADLVKFAKALPEAEENEANYTRAYYFVENTKQQEPSSDSKRDIIKEAKIGE